VDRRISLLIFQDVVGGGLDVWFSLCALSGASRMQKNNSQHRVK